MINHKCATVKRYFAILSVDIWTGIPDELPINSLTTTALFRSLLYL